MKTLTNYLFSFHHYFIRDYYMTDKDKKTKRAPNWHRDEIILALDLYHSLEPSERHKDNDSVIRLSQILNKLPIHKNRHLFPKFRNPNGIELKLRNFESIDPRVKGKGMSNISKQDKEIFDEFINAKSELSSIASQIKAVIADEDYIHNLDELHDEDTDNISSAIEGTVIYKFHKMIERNRKIVDRKKKNYLNNHGKLDCEVCGFDFYKVYGSIGEGFIEAHHKLPLSKLNGTTKTNLNDLALVCSNCHRMLHREINTLSIDGLKARIQEQTSSQR